MSDHPSAPQPTPPEQPAPQQMTNAGMWLLVIVGVVLLLCGCCSIVPTNADGQVPSDENRVTLMTELVLQVGCIIGGLVCLGVALRRYTTVTPIRAAADGRGGSVVPGGADGGGATDEPAPAGAPGTGAAWTMLVLGIVLLLGSCFLGLGVGIIASILVTDPADVAGPYVIAGALALAVIAGLVLGGLAIRAGYRRLG